MREKLLLRHWEEGQTEEGQGEKPQEEKDRLARLIYQADESFNQLVYGSEEAAVAIITAMMDMEGSYFDRKHLLCAFFEGALAGVVVHFPTEKKAAIDQKSGQAFAKSMWLFTLAKRIPTFLKIGKATTSQIFNSQGGYIHTICVGPSYRGCGIGRAMVEQLTGQYGSLQLDVNMHKEESRKFYQAMGFRQMSLHQAKIKGSLCGTYAMYLGPEN